MNIYRILNVLFHIAVPFIWVANVLCVVYIGLFAAFGLALISVIALPITYIRFWMIMYPRYKQPTMLKTIWFIIKNK